MALSTALRHLWLSEGREPKRAPICCVDSLAADNQPWHSACILQLYVPVPQRRRSHCSMGP